MSIQELIAFFQWCTIINGGILIFWSLFCMLAPDLTYSIQSKFFPLPRATFDTVIYSFLGLFKIFFIIFNLVPYIALLIIA